MCPDIRYFSFMQDKPKLLDQAESLTPFLKLEKLAKPNTYFRAQTKQIRLVRNESLLPHLRRLQMQRLIM
jgi:hypothetical protein